MKQLKFTFKEVNINLEFLLVYTLMTLVLQIYKNNIEKIEINYEFIWDDEERFVLLNVHVPSEVMW